MFPEVLRVDVIDMKSYHAESPTIPEVQKDDNVM